MMNDELAELFIIHYSLNHIHTPILELVSFSVVKIYPI